MSAYATLIETLWWLAAGLTAAACAYLLLTLVAVAANLPRGANIWSKPPAVTVLKPLCGLEDGLDLATESFLRQQVNFPLRFVFGVASADDPALALVQQIAAKYLQHSAKFVVDGTVHGPNPKVSNLINMAKVGLDEVVVISDSDIVIAPSTLQRAVDALAEPGLGAVTALYRSRPGRDEPIRHFAGWFLDYWFLPMAVLHARLAPLSVTYGPLTALRREVLEQAGGLEALAHHLSDDAELGARVCAQGLRIAFTPDISETLVNDDSHAALFDHELRWSRTVRGLDPLGFAASVVSHPGPLPLLLLIHPGWLAVAGVLAPVLLRWLLVRMVEQRFGRAENLPRPGLIGIWARDCYCFAVWLAACLVSRVGWRGQKLAVKNRDILADAP